MPFLEILSSIWWWRWRRSKLLWWWLVWCTMTRLVMSHRAEKWESHNYISTDVWQRRVKKRRARKRKPLEDGGEEAAEGCGKTSVLKTVSRIHTCMPKLKSVLCFHDVKLFSDCSTSSGRFTSDRKSGLPLPGRLSPLYTDDSCGDKCQIMITFSPGDPRMQRCIQSLSITCQSLHIYCVPE